MDTANIRICIDKPIADGTFPIYVRIIQNRRKKDIAIGIRCKKNHFKNGELTKQHPNYAVDNELISRFKAKALSIIRKFQLENIDFSLNDFENVFRGEKKNNNIDVFNFFDEIVEELIMSDKIGNANTYKDTKNALLKFHKQYSKNKNLCFKDVTPTYLSKFEVFMRSRGNTDGGISVKMRTLRALVNKAISRKLISKDLYSFDEYKISKLKPTLNKRALSIDEFKRIRDLDLTNYPHLVDAHNYFMFSFYARGINFVDMMKLRWPDIQDNKLYYIRSKTKGNFKMEVNERMQEILDYYKALERPTNYVFPILLRENLTSQQIEDRKEKVLKRINSRLITIAELAAVDKHITTYTARHSYATILKFKGVSVSEISESMGHKELGTTEIYLKSFDTEIFRTGNVFLQTLLARAGFQKIFLKLFRL